MDPFDDESSESDGSDDGQEERLSEQDQGEHDDEKKGGDEKEGGVVETEFEKTESEGTVGMKENGEGMDMGENVEESIRSEIGMVNVVSEQECSNSKMEKPEVKKKRGRPPKNPMKANENDGEEERSVKVPKSKRSLKKKEEEVVKDEEANDKGKKKKISDSPASSGKRDYDEEQGDEGGSFMEIQQQFTIVTSFEKLTWKIPERTFSPVSFTECSVKRFVNQGEDTFVIQLRMDKRKGFDVVENCHFFIDGNVRHCTFDVREEKLDVFGPSFKTPGVCRTTGCEIEKKGDRGYRLVFSCVE